MLLPGESITYSLTSMKKQTKKKKYEFHVGYRVEAMIEVIVEADTEEEAKSLVENSDTHPKFGDYTDIQDFNVQYVGVRNDTKGWRKFNS